MSTPFVSIIREHKKGAQERRKELDTKKQELTESIEACTATSLSDVSKASIAIAHTQKSLEMEAATIGEMADHFNRRVTTWCGSYIALNEAIKQLGDVAQWTQVVEADMDFIAKVLDNAAQTHNQTFAPKEAPSPAPESPSQDK